MLKSDLGQICCHSPDADDNRLVLLTRLSLDYSHTYATRTCTARAGCANMRRACSVRGHEQCRAQIHQSLQNWWEMLSQQEIPFWVVRWCGGYEESSFTLLQGGRRGKVAKCCNGSNTVSCWLVKRVKSAYEDNPAQRSKSYMMVVQSWAVTVTRNHDSHAVHILRQWHNIT